MIKKIKKWIKDWKSRRRMKKRIAELKKRDRPTE